MKKTLYLITLIALLSSCSNENYDNERDAKSQSNEIRLCSILQGMTRSNSLGLQSTQIVPGQQVGVYIDGSETPMTNCPWLIGADGAMENLGNKAYWVGTDIDITAYHPYMSDEEIASQTFRVKTDQSTNADYLASDLLYAQRSASRTNSPVPLTFYHKLSKIMIQLVSDDYEDISGAKIYVSGTKTETLFNVNEPQIAPQGPTADILASIATAQYPSGAAIIIPQTLEKGTPFIKVFFDNIEYRYNLPEEMTFNSGKSYLYTVNVRHASREIQLLSYEVIDWNMGEGEEGDLEEEFPDKPDLPGIIPTVENDILNVTMSGIRYDYSWMTLYGDKNTPATQNAWVYVDDVLRPDLDIENCNSESNIATDIVFLVDNSGSMSEEANAVASQIESWSQTLEASGLNVKFGIVGFAETGYINGAINMTSANAIQSYLDRTTGTNRTVGFAGSDASQLQEYANSYTKLAGENGVMALRMADEHFTFRPEANRVYIMFTDEANQTSGNEDFSVEYVKNHWSGTQGTVHVIFSNTESSLSTYNNGEKPWLLAQYTGGTYTFTNAAFTGVNLADLDVTGALTHSYIMRCPIPRSLQDGNRHKVTVSVRYPNGYVTEKSVMSILPKVDITD